MPRYIDIEPIEKCDKGESIAVSFALLKAQPTANVRENVHAKWIVEEVYSNWSDWTNVRCPVCRRVFEKFYRSNFCPNCGAKMDEVM